MYLKDQYANLITIDIINHAKCHTPELLYWKLNMTDFDVYTFTYYFGLGPTGPAGGTSEDL